MSVTKSENSLRRALRPDELQYVDESVRPMVQRCWENGEEVPATIMLVSGRPLSRRESERGAEILAEGWE